MTMKNSRSIGWMLSVVAIALLTAAVYARQASDPEVQLRAAIQKEEVAGDLQAAITLYKQLAKSKNRNVAAQALLRLGACYEKQGSAEAKKTFEQLIGEFADQKEIVAQAQVRLAALGPKSVISSAGPSLHQIPVPVLPSGRYLGFTPDGSSVLSHGKGGLSITDLTTRMSRELIPPRDLGIFLFAPVSPDSRHIAYSTYVGNPSRSEVRLFSLAENSYKTIYSPETRSDEVDFVAFAADGKSVFATVSGSENKVIRIPLAGGEIKKYTVSKHCGNPKPGPDDKYLACTIHSRGAQTRSYLLDLETGKEIPISELNGIKDIIGWSPFDPGVILFTRQQAASMGIWQLRIAGGKAQGSPELLRPNVGAISPLLLNDIGSLVYWIRPSAPAIYLLPMDSSGKKVDSKPERIDPPNLRAGRQPAWSPDGETLAFLCSDSTGSPEQSASLLYLWRPADRSSRLVKLDVPQDNYYLKWHSDGKHIFSRPARNGREISRIDVQNGTTEIFDAHQVLLDWSADGKRFYTMTPHESPGGLWEIDADSGKERPLFTTKSNGSVTSANLSPDEKWIVFPINESVDGIPRRSLVMAEVKSGKSRTLMLPEKRQYFPVGWSADSKYAYFWASSNQCFAASIEGGEPTPIDLGLTEGGIPRMVPHPDGRRYAVATTQSSPLEYWVMEEFLPKPKANK